jgi:hypothetical protein
MQKSLRPNVWIANPTRKDPGSLWIAQKVTVKKHRGSTQNLPGSDQKIRRKKSAFDSVHRRGEQASKREIQ